MSTYRYLQLDVFTDRPGAGNPLGVVLAAETMDSATMQAFAAWVHLSETIFFLPVTTAGADYHIRIFTPRQELPFAGHPSVGAAWVAVHCGLAQPRNGELVQQCAAGNLPVRVEKTASDLRIRVRSPRARPVGTASAFSAELSHALQGWSLGKLSPRLWNNGPSWWLVEMADAASVRQLQPNLQAIAQLTRRSHATGLAVYSHADSGDHHLAVRAFCPADNIPEDPVTGSANAAIGALLHHEQHLPQSRLHYFASQGRELGRDGRVEVHIDDQAEVWIGGAVQLIIQGQMDW